MLFRRLTVRTAVILAVAGGVALVPMMAAAGPYGGGFHGGGGFRGGGYGGFHGGYGGFHGGYGYGGYGYGGYGYRGFGGYYGGFGLGDALLGAAIIGGTAAIISSSVPRYYQTYPVPTYPVYAPPLIVAPPVRYGYAPLAIDPSQTYRVNDPVDQCSRAAVSEAAARGDDGRVMRIDRVDAYQNGANVIGTLEVRRSDRNGARETARFMCTVSFGQVTAFHFG